MVFANLSSTTLCKLWLKNSSKFDISFQDVDECNTGVHNCPSNEACINTEGTYRCDCGPGREWDSNTKHCKGKQKLTVLP